MLDTSNGKARARAWPRPRPTTRTPGQIASEKKFRAAQQATKFFAPKLYADCITAVSGTPLLPRDIMTSMLYQQFVYLIMPDGTPRYPMSSIYDVSRSLDALGAQPGYTLVRTADRWEQRPWLPGGAAGALIASQGLATASDSTSAFATKGNIILPVFDIVVRGIMVRIATNGSYRVVLAELSNTNVITAILGQSTIVPVVGAQNVRFPFPDSVPVTANRRLAILIVRVDGTGTAVCGVPAAAGTTPGQYWTYNPIGLARLASNNPTVGANPFLNGTDSVTLQFVHAY